ncbi:MAG TPA: phage tail tube protein [Acidocella sp.]|jgi:hypothetical protein|uniref:phage tail tube protein n=1 Tax=Acidocella sp. TaxID=50710 RepID=UPI002BB5002F|nr:phage tail tube protein [Acidocella sp.]HVE20654.1 phage tail tube protein [Acidocella sp.]
MAAIVTGGIATIKIDGVQYMMRGSAKVKPGTVKRAPIVNQDGSVVFTQTADAPSISCDFSDWGGLSIVNISQIAGSTIAISLTNGKSYTLTNGTYTDATELNAEDGSFPVVFVGSSCNEQLVAS